MKNFYFFSLLFLMQGIFAGDEEPFLYVVIPTYKNKNYCIENIRTLHNQTYQSWKAIIIVDGAPTDDDGTYELIREYIKEHHLEDKIKLIKNNERKLGLYNIYSAVHRYAHDDWVVVLYDGDDFFINPKALQRIAQEYKKESTWFTYGQYINYPDRSLGNCRTFPEAVLKNNSFRNHGWIASHPRTFYAWLFKKISLQDLVHDGLFYSVAWDVAFLPMLEMAGKEHISFIPDVLYAYRHHPNNDYATNIQKVYELEKIIRAQRSYKKLEKKPASLRNEKKADIVVFSKDRPLQLYAFLESATQQMSGINSITIIYKASSKKYNDAFQTVSKAFPDVHFINEDSQKSKFKPLVLSTLKNLNSEYVIFAVDDNVVVDAINIPQAIKQLEATNAYGVFFRMGLHIHYCVPEKNNKYYEIPPVIELNDEVYAWQFGGGTGSYIYKCGSGDWRYPTSLDMTLYRRTEVLHDLENIQFHNPNTLEGNWSSTATKKMRKIGICYKKAKAVNVPLNSVKDGQPLPHMHIEPTFLLEQFQKNLKLDWKPLTKTAYKSVHVMHAPTYIKR